MTRWLPKCNLIISLEVDFGTEQNFFAGDPIRVRSNALKSRLNARIDLRWIYFEFDQPASRVATIRRPVLCAGSVRLARKA